MRPKDILQIAALTIPFMCIISINLIAKIYNKVEAGEQERERVHIGRQFLFHSSLTPFCGASIRIEMADKQINKQQQQ